MKLLMLSFLAIVAVCGAEPGGGQRFPSADSSRLPSPLPQPPSDVLRVMSFNIRYGTAADGENRWDLRRDWVLETIQARQPDLLGTQETLQLQREFLDAKLTGYQSWGVGRDDGNQKGEMTAVWYREELFERIDAGHFWLSENPDQPGSVSWDSSLTRMASWVKLQDRRHPDSRPILFLNTHFDHRGKQARTKSAALIREKAQEWGKTCDVLVVGDFNAGTDEEPYQILFAASDTQKVAEVDPSSAWRLVDSYRAVHPEPEINEGTFSGFQSAQTSGPRIDWIAVSNGWRVEESGIDRTARNGRTPSDHFPVYATVNRSPR